jgi:ATP-dependent Clp protease ATP-binding subunit ClpA
VEDVFFIDATNATGPGIVDKLFSRPETKIILADEIEKLSIKDQNMLLNFLETGKLVSTKVKKTREMEFKGTKLFATSNDIDMLSKPLKSRADRTTSSPNMTLKNFEIYVLSFQDPSLDRVYLLFPPVHHLKKFYLH